MNAQDIDRHASNQFHGDPTVVDDAWEGKGLIGYCADGFD